MGVAEATREDYNGLVPVDDDEEEDESLWGSDAEEWWSVDEDDGKTQRWTPEHGDFAKWLCGLKQRQWIDVVNCC